MLQRQELIRIALALVFLILGAVTAARAETPPEDLLGKARVAAAADRHTEAIQYYLAAIEVKPALRSDVSMEVGDQYTWADMPDSAIDWYEYYLLAHPNDVDANLGLARAYAWSDRLDESAAHYETMLADAGDRRAEVMLGLARVRSWRDDVGGAERLYLDILEEEPDNVDARLGLAQVTNWSGRHRDAEAMYREVLADEPDNTEAQQGLAYALAWQGRHDMAVEVLGTNESNQRTAADVGRRGWASGHHTYSFRDNTTDGNFHNFRSQFKYQPEQLTEIGVAYGHGVLDQSGFPKITRDELTFMFRQRFSALLEVNANPGYQWNRFDPILLSPNTDTTNDFDFFMWDIYATLTPHDWVRIDVGTARTSVDIPRPIYMKIHATSTAVGLDWRWTPLVTSFWQLRVTNFSDSNRRVITSGQVDYTPPLSLPIPARNRFIVSGDAAYWDTDKETNNGYFSPLSYSQLGARLRFITDIGRRTSIDVSGRMGLEKEKSFEWVSVGAFEAGLRYRLAREVYLRAGYATSGSRLTAADGFRAKTFYVSIDYPLAR